MLQRKYMRVFELGLVLHLLLESALLFSYNQIN